MTFPLGSTTRLLYRKGRSTHEHLTGGFFWGWYLQKRIDGSWLKAVRYSIEGLRIKLATVRFLYVISGFSKPAKRAE
jgi:hypothetical protein